MVLRRAADDFGGHGGLRRRRAESELERLSEAATRRALRRADTALLLTDLSAGATRQDKRTAALIWEAGKAAVVGANKSDLVPAKERAGRAARLAEALPFLSPPRAFHFSAARGRVPALGMMDAALRAAGMNARQFPTAKLTRILEEMVSRHPPPRAGGGRPKLRYAHQGGERPPMIVIHGSATTRTGAEYRRYLESGFARELGLAGVPLRVVFRES